jgi:threonine dehydrogenase-like Zn-dependent dehydrogenase
LLYKSTGWYCASRYLKDLSPEDRKTTVAVAVGCGPVGICGITAALTMVDTVYAIDSVPERLAEAEKLGAKTILLDDNPVEKIKAATDGRGADVVMEFVGHGDALQLGIDLARPFGQISCVGVHTEVLQLNGLSTYSSLCKFASEPSEFLLICTS